MSTLSAIMAKFDSKTLYAFFAITATWLGLHEAGVDLPWQYFTAAVLGISFKEGMAKRPVA
jgi:hypothetical protein